MRALLLYPMNALANDQMKRLRQLLAGSPDITFGRYTGETESDPLKSPGAFAELNIGEPLLPNEILSRQEMRERPPHLLLTNYAMLEYLLLRPLDMDLFATGAESKWRFIVVDEAHVYDGTGCRDRDAVEAGPRPSRAGPTRFSASQLPQRWVATATPVPLLDLQLISLANPSNGPR